MPPPHPLAPPHHFLTHTTRNTHTTHTPPPALVHPQSPTPSPCPPVPPPQPLPHPTHSPQASPPCHPGPTPGPHRPTNSHPDATSHLAPLPPPRLPPLP